jgi:hypothetical protein
MQLENHVGHGILRAATGVSRDRFRTACDQLALLWSLHRRHTETLAALRSIRQRHRRLTPDDLAALRRIVDGVDVPAEPRSTADLAAMMEKLGEQVRRVLDGADRVWTRLGPCLDRCEAHLAAADGHAAALGSSARLVVEALRSRLDTVRRIALPDPLSRWTGTDVDAADAEALEADCARVETELAELAELRAGADEALAQARAAVRTVERREWEAVLRRAEVAVKVVVRTGAMRDEEDIACGSAAVHAALTRADARVEAADWIGFGAAMADVRAAVAEATARAESVVREVGRPLQVRAELRHRLDLYRAKAAATGRAEDADLDRLHRRAHDLLWMAPTEIATAEEAVDAYRRAVNESPRRAREEEYRT